MYRLTESFNISRLTDQLFRHEAGKMVAVLTKIFGTENLQLAEDTVQDTFISAIHMWSLKGIPAWLGHVERGVDGIGLADVVFPAFLFIVGLSLPFAIDNRRKKGDSEGQLVMHVLVRTIALLVMGVFLVNGETINAPAMGIPKFLWNTLCCLSFILIWNVYPKTAKRSLVYTAKAIGIITLITLAIISGTVPNVSGLPNSPKLWS